MARHSKCANFTPCKHGWQRVCSVPMLAEWRDISIRRQAVVATCGYWHCLLTVCYSSNICQVGAKYLEFTGTGTTPSYKGSQVKVTTTENWSTWLQLEYTHRQVWVSLHLCMCEFHCTCACVSFIAPVQVWVSLHLCRCEFHCTCAGVSFIAPVEVTAVAGITIYSTVWVRNRTESLSKSCRQNLAGTTNSTQYAETTLIKTTKWNSNPT